MASSSLPKALYSSPELRMRVVRKPRIRGRGPEARRRKTL